MYADIRLRKERLQLCLSFDIILHEKILAIEHSIREIVDPVAQNNGERSGTQHQIEFDVAVSVDKVIDIGRRCQLIFGIKAKMFFILAHIIGFFTVYTLHTDVFVH